MGVGPTGANAVGELLREMGEEVGGGVGGGVDGPRGMVDAGAGPNGPGVKRAVGILRGEGVELDADIGLLRLPAQPASVHGGRPAGVGQGAGGLSDVLVGDRASECGLPAVAGAEDGEVADERVRRVSETPMNTLPYRFDGPEGAPVLILGPSLGTTWHMS